VRKKLFFFILLVGMLSGSAKSLSFRQVAYIPVGITWNGGYIRGYDFNHDGYQDLGFSKGSGPPRLIYYSYRSFNRYVFQDSSGPSSDLFWDLGDLDGDSLVDVVAQGNIYPTAVRVFEASSYWTFPEIMVWSWRFEYIGNGTQNMYITDLDRDSLKEILTADHKVMYVFENRGDNLYVKVFSDTAPAETTPPFAYGDFDGDGLMEYSCGTYGSAVYVYECSGPDQYRLAWSGMINTANMCDIISMPDVDGDGKLEFMVGSSRTGVTQWAGKLHVFESTGNDQYQVIYAESILVTDRGVYCPRSDCGDVDRDGRPELVWAIDRDWMVYKSPGNNQFQRVFSAYGDNGHNSTNIHIHDMNGNGYPEIIESGGNETHIWEVEACQVVYPNGGETLYCDTSYTIRWRNVSPFVADSFSLFFSTDSSRSYSLIARGIPGSDSSYVWTVPDTVSDTCFIMIWAYQNATGWDFSDSHFRIRNGTGVEVTTPYPLHPTPLPLSVAPNPFVSYAKTPGHEAESFALYDVSGRKVGVYKGDRIGSGLSAGIYFLKPEGQDSKPLRIVKLR